MLTFNIPRGTWLGFLTKGSKSYGQEYSIVCHDKPVAQPWTPLSRRYSINYAALLGNGNPNNFVKQIVAFIWRLDTFYLFAMHYHYI